MYLSRAESCSNLCVTHPSRTSVRPVVGIGCVPRRSLLGAWDKNRVDDVHPSVRRAHGGDDLRTADPGCPVFFQDRLRDSVNHHQRLAVAQVGNVKCRCGDVMMKNRLELELVFLRDHPFFSCHQGSRRREEVEYLDDSDSDDDAPTGGKVR